jgi:hypothetical protein
VEPVGGDYVHHATDGNHVGDTIENLVFALHFWRVVFPKLSLF